MHKLFFVEAGDIADIDDHIENYKLPNNMQDWHIKSVHPVASHDGSIYAYVVLTSEDDYFPQND